MLVLVSQSVMLSYLLSRQDGPFAPDNPNASAAAATNVANNVATSQIALPKQACDEAYATAGYESSVTHCRA